MTPLLWVDVFCVVLGVLAIACVIAEGAAQSREDALHEAVINAYRRGPSLRYSKDDDGSPEWLAEYFSRLDGE